MSHIFRAVLSVPLLVIPAASAATPVLEAPAAVVTPASTGRNTQAFPVPTRPLVLADPGAGHGHSLAAVLAAFEAATGQKLVIVRETCSRLEVESTSLSGAISVPPDEVYLFVESLLFKHGYLTAKIKGGTVPMIAVHTSFGNEPLSGWLDVDEESIASYDDHPALLVTTLLDVSPLDARALSSVIRSVLRANNRNSVIALSGSHLMLAGTGRETARIAWGIRQARDMEREARSQDTPPSPPEEQ